MQQFEEALAREIFRVGWDADVAAGKIPQTVLDMAPKGGRKPPEYVPLSAQRYSSRVLQRFMDVNGLKAATMRQRLSVARPRDRHKLKALARAVADAYGIHSKVVDYPGCAIALKSGYGRGLYGPTMLDFVCSGLLIKLYRRLNTLALGTDEIAHEKLESDLMAVCAEDLGRFTRLDTVSQCLVVLERRGSL